MATATLPALLDSLRQSIALVAETTPKLKSLTPPEDGLSLLDVKNELLMSYLEHMVFLILLKLRNTTSKPDTELSLEDSPLGRSIVKKLIELRLYLEKGVRPLEEKLRYQVEKALRAAQTAENTERAKESAAAAAGSDSDDDDDDSASGSDEDDSESDDESAEQGENVQISGIDRDEGVGMRANRAAFARPTSGVAAATAGKRTGKEAKADGAATGVYRPPRIAATMMPTTERRQRAERRPLKSATMDEFIADELSTAPMAELSIGANIASRGRHLTTASERKRDDERREYEERNFVRLPKESKKEGGRRNKANSTAMNFGGEEWRGLGEGVDRINRLTQRKASGGSGGGVRAMLDKSRKRGRDTVDGPRGDGSGGAAIAERFQKRARFQEMGRRDRGKKK